MFDAWKQRQRQRLENRPERTVFYNIFATMMLVLAVELLMAVASILAINVTGQLDENAKDLLTMRVRNRASYVQEILRNAEDLEQLSEQITATTQQLLKSGDISLDTLDNSSEQSDALLVALAPQLLDTLRLFDFEADVVAAELAEAVGAEDARGDLRRIARGQLARREIGRENDRLFLHQAGVEQLIEDGDGKLRRHLRAEIVDDQQIAVKYKFLSFCFISGEFGVCQQFKQIKCGKVHNAMC